MRIAGFIDTASVSPVSALSACSGVVAGDRFLQGRICQLLTFGLLCYSDTKVTKRTSSGSEKFLALSRGVKGIFAAPTESLREVAAPTES